MGEEEEGYQEDILHLSSEDSDEQSQEYMDSEVDKDIEGIISREKHREMASRPIPRLRDAQTMTEVTVTYNTESQTTRKITRERMNQTETQQKFDTESQTDNTPTRERMSQTESLLTVDSDTQTTQYHETVKSQHVRVNIATEIYTQTEPSKVSEMDTQTNLAELSDTQTQTAVKTFDENGFQTDEKEVSCGSMQTDVTPTSNVNLQTEFDKTDLVFQVKSTQGKLIRMLKTEETEINENFKRKYESLLPLISTARSTFLARLMIQICEDFGDQENQTAKALADLVLLNLQKTSNRESECQDIQEFTARAKEVVNMGKDFAFNKMYIHALISYYTAAKLYKLINKGDESVRGIKTCLRHTRLVVKNITKQESMKEIIIGHVIVVMRKMIDFIRSIQNSTHTSRIYCEAGCLYDIGLCYSYCGEDQQCATENEPAIKLLETEIKENAKNYRIYGLCLNNAGNAYRRIGNITKALELYKRALEAYESAKDWNSEEQKQNSIKKTEKHLRMCKAHLKK